MTLVTFAEHEARPGSSADTVKHGPDKHAKNRLADRQNVTKVTKRVDLTPIAPCGSIPSYTL
jgi:hypothetical protein